MFKLKLEKVVLKGNKCYKILGWEGSISKNELPEKYTKPGTLFFYTDKNFEGEECLRIYNAHIPLVRSWSSSSDPFGSCQTFKVNEVYKEDVINNLIAKLKEAGSRLSEIRKEIKKLEEEWNGEVEVII